jgi:hypothetical protein
MNPLALLFFIAAASAMWLVPRKFAPAPLMACACYMTLGQGIEIGPVSLPIMRMLMAVGLLRILVKGERIEGGLVLIDKIVLAMAGWLLFASFFHDGMESSGPVYISGLLFNLLLMYFLTRVWTRNPGELEDLIKIIAILLVPVAISMIAEKLTARNAFSVFGGINDTVLAREGKLRAQGPFKHPILAGTVGATCIPLFAGILPKYRSIAMVGIASGMAMVLASASSGPVMSLAASLFALGCWKLRRHMRLVTGSAIAAYLVLMMVMNRPPYYLIAEIDISGGSTGWHRAFLIEQTFKYLHEWWLFGTDVTRHWMPYQGIANSENHTDVTNYYIAFGIMGGLPAMLLLVLALVVSLRRVIELQAERDAASKDEAFMIWSFGAGMFAHAATSISVSYFDQSMLFFWLNLAVISSVCAAAGERVPEACVAGGHLLPDMITTNR